MQKTGQGRGKGGGIDRAKAGAKGDFEGRRAKGTPPLEMPTVSSETQNNKVQEHPKKSSFPLRWGAGRGLFHEFALPHLIK